MSHAAWRKTIVDTMAALLGPKGFVRKANVFVCELDEVTHIIATQSSMSTTRDRLKVTVNSGIFCKLIGSIQRHSVHTVSTADCHWTKRIGEYLPQSEDKWWVVETDAAARLASKEITDILSSAILPELDRLACTEDLRLLWAGGRSPGLTSGQRKKLLALIENL